MECLNFLHKWVDPKDLDLNGYTNNGSKGCS